MRETKGPGDILGLMLQPVGRAMTPELAQELADLRAAPEVQARLDELAEGCNEGTLDDAERAEYDGYVQAIHLIGILQAKARRALKAGGTA
ncbi:hypothetical protein EP7_000110 [Isosphaeraceae bacterium EP7]